MIDTLPRPKRVLARLARFDGAYLRFTGDAVRCSERGSMVEDHADDGDLGAHVLRPRALTSRSAARGRRAQLGSSTVYETISVMRPSSKS